MDRRQPMLLISDPMQVSSGLHPDKHGLHVPLWETGENVRFYQGKVRRLLPPSSLYVTDSSTKMRGLSQHQDSAGTRWRWSAQSNGQVHRQQGALAEELIEAMASFQVDQSTTAPATYVDFVHWGNWTLYNSGIGAIRRYIPGTGSADLTGAPTNVIAMLKRANQLFALGTDSTDKEVAWSDADDITNWTASASTLAGALSLEDLDTGIRAGSKLSGNIAAYAEDQLALIFWVGAPFYFGGKVELDGIGATGKLAVAVDGPLNYGLSRNGGWVTDGRSSTYIDDALHDYWQEEVNWDQASKVVVARNDVNRCIEFHLPMRDELEVSEAWSFDPATRGWSQVVPMQVMVERKLFSRPLGAKNGTVYLLENDATASGTLSLITKPLLMQQANGHPLRAASLCDEVELVVKTATNVEFRYGVAERLVDGPYDWSEWQPVDTNLVTHQHGLTISGTFHKLEFRSTQQNWSLDLQGFALYGVPEGTKGARP